MGTRSAAIAIATKSKKGTISSKSPPRSFVRAWISLKPIPQPHKSLKGYGQAACLGSKIAVACGSSSLGK